MAPDGFPSEISAPEGWESVRIQAEGLDELSVAELRDELRQTGLPLTEEGNVFIVQNAAPTELDAQAFLRGVVPDLETRGFRVEWVCPSL